MRRRGLWLAALLGAVACLAAGCGFAKDRQSAEIVADEYLTAVANQDLDKAMSLWDARGFQHGITEKEWRKMLTSMPKKLGKMKDHKMVGWKALKGRLSGLNGTFCDLNYEVTYAKYPSQEVVTLYRPTGGDHFLVIGHHINCKGLLM